MIKERMKLLDKIMDARNIFNSIFCMESYVFEKGLLDTTEPVCLCDDGGIIAANDLALYYALADKHNVELIEKVPEVFKINPDVFSVFPFLLQEP